MTDLSMSIFIGGPLDGHTRVMEPASDPAVTWLEGEPPMLVWVDLAPVPSRNMEVTRVAYARRRETRLNAEFGSVWEYLYVPPPEGSNG